jgi:NAD-dependent SIR2 family protein deacetylase
MTHMPQDDADRAIASAAGAIAEADALLITAGAGMGVDSGLPDFRGAGGFWRAYPRLGQLGVSFEEMAQPRWFREDPAMAWAFYGHRQMLYRDTAPHEGFARLERWGAAMKAGYGIYTSNVDGQFQRAGFDPERIVECHGSIHRMQCVRPCTQATWLAPSREFQIDDATFRVRGELPRCPHCGNVSRPNVLMFMDRDWISGPTDDAHRRHIAWLATIEGTRLVFVELGAGAHLPAIRSYSERTAEWMSATLIRINPAAPHGPARTISIALPAKLALARIDAAMVRTRA